jgi:activator of HSP90 ATPase
MSAESVLGSAASAYTRRQVIATLGVALGGLTVGWNQCVAASQQDMQEVPSKPENLKRTALHQEAPFNVAPQRVYDVLLDSKQFAAFSGLPAEIDPKAGGSFSMFGGMIVGRNIELIPNARIVQAWRPTHWDPGVYSVAKFELKAAGNGTQVILDHTGFPEGDFDSLSSGWKLHYWERMAKFLG